MRLRSNRDIYVWLIFFALVLLWFYPGLSMYFSQDDFWLLKVSRVDLSDWWRLFIPADDVVWYRPLSSQVFFFLAELLFGLNPIPYHFLVLFTHSLTMFFLYKLMKLLNQSDWTGITAALFFGLHQLHTVSVSWLAAYSFVLGATLFVLSLFFFLKGQSRLLFITSILSVLVNEMLLLLPFAWFSFSFDYSNNRRKSVWRISWTYLLLAGSIVWLRFIKFPTTVTTDFYKFTLSGEIFSALKFYLLRFAGVPLSFDQVFFPLQVISIILLVVWVGVWSWGIGRCCHVLKRKKSQIIMFLTVWFAMLVPFLFLTNHVSPHYLSFAWVGGAAVTAIGFEEMGKGHFKIYFLGILAFLLLQFVGSRWTYQTHWIFQRAEMAKRLVGENYLLHPVGSEEYFSLGAGAAAEVFKK